MSLESTESRVRTFCLVLLTVIAIALALFWLRPIMIPFILAVVATYILTPLINLQQNHLKFPKFLAIITTLALAGIFIFLFWLLIYYSVNQISMNADQYQTKIEELVLMTSTHIPLEKFGVDAKDLIEQTAHKISAQTGNIVLGSINTIFGLFSKGILILIFTLFLLLGKEFKTRPEGTWANIEFRIKKYLITKLFISIITGTLVGGILFILNIDLAIAFGVFAFILNFIPSIGSIIATLLPLPIILVTPNITLMAASLAIILPGAIQFSVGNIIEPKIMGDSLDLHPVAILMALIFWGMIWGIVGMLLAAPLTAIMKIIFEKIEITHPLAHLLAGRVEHV